MNPLTDEQEIALDVELCKRSFKEFVIMAWPIVETATYIDGWHIDAVCNHLQAVYTGKIRHLIINIPPRQSKSLITSVLFPAWCWTMKPEMRFMCLSYGMNLVIRDNVKSRELIRSPWYQSRWGNVFQLSQDQNQKERYQNDKGGLRLIATVLGSATGDGGDVIIIDDFNQASESDDVRRNALEWYDSTIPTRLNDPKKGSIISIQQRTAQNDLTGHLLEQGSQWELLKLPMEYEGDDNATCLGFKDPRTENGELLNPSRFGPEEVAVLKKGMSSFVAAGQLQQRPTSKEGGLLNSSWFKEWVPTTLPETFDECIISLDASFKGGKGADWNVIQLWKRKNSQYYLIDQVRGQWDFVQLQAQVISFCNKWPEASAKIIEESANGPAIIASLKNIITGLIPYKAKDSKEARVSSVAPMIESGNVYLPKAAFWKEDFLLECHLFPRGKHDDQVDCCSQALLRFSKTQRRSIVFGQHSIWP